MFLSWAGMRGAVSLAAALALPLETDAGGPFPGRDLVLFLTFSVILATLVGQGLTLPFVIRVLRLEDDGADTREETKARIRAAEAAIARLEVLEAEDWVREDTAGRLRGLYDFRTDRFRARFEDGDDGAIESRSRTTSGCAASCSTPSGRRSPTCEAPARSATTSGSGSARDLDLEDERLDI